MNGKAQKYWTLFTSTFELSACTFGGGFVIIPLMRRKFVDELHWIEEQEMLDLTAIAQSSPGAIAVNASILVGYHVAGGLGALLTVLGTVIPPLVIISLVSLCYTAVRDNAAVTMIMAGMLAGVGAVICDVVVTMTKGLLALKRALPVVMLAATFAAVRFFGVSIVVIILLCGLIGAADTMYLASKEKKVRSGADGGSGQEVPDDSRTVRETLTGGGSVQESPVDCESVQGTPAAGRGEQKSSLSGEGGDRS